MSGGLGEYQSANSCPPAEIISACSSSLANKCLFVTSACGVLIQVQIEFYQIFCWVEWPTLCTGQLIFIRSALRCLQLSTIWIIIYIVSGGDLHYLIWNLNHIWAVWLWTRVVWVGELHFRMLNTLRFTVVISKCVKFSPYPYIHLFSTYFNF